MALDWSRLKRRHSPRIESPSEQMEKDNPLFCHTLTLLLKAYENGSTLGDIGISSGKTSSAMGFP